MTLPERETVARRPDEAAAGRGGVVLIGGEPGVGKTRLCEEALELGLESRMLPLVGYAHEEQGAPFIVSTEIPEDIVRALPPETLGNALGDTAPVISRLPGEALDRHVFSNGTGRVARTTRDEKRPPGQAGARSP